MGGESAAGCIATSVFGVVEVECPYAAADYGAIEEHLPSGAPNLGAMPEVVGMLRALVDEVFADGIGGVDKLERGEGSGAYYDEGDDVFVIAFYLWPKAGGKYCEAAEEGEESATASGHGEAAEEAEGEDEEGDFMRLVLCRENAAKHHEEEEGK